MNGKLSTLTAQQRAETFGPFEERSVSQRSSLEVGVQLLECRWSSPGKLLDDDVSVSEQRLDQGLDRVRRGEHRHCDILGNGHVVELGPLCGHSRTTEFTARLAWCLRLSAMAIFHRDDQTHEGSLIADWALTQPWGPPAEVPIEVIGSYRFDDPDARAGMEIHLVKAGTTLLQIPLTYRDEPSSEPTTL
jgi:hypothetical protein